MKNYTIWITREGRGGTVDVGASTQEEALRIVAKRCPEWEATHIAEVAGIQGPVIWKAPLWMEYAQ